MKDKNSKLSNELIDYAAIVESMIGKSLKGLAEKNKKILDEVVEIDENRVNEFEIKMDEEIFEFIAQYEPKAVDLRRSLMMLKMNNDLERMGDHAVNICESAFFLIERPALSLSDQLPQMAAHVIEMVRESIESFVKSDVELAEKVCGKDDAVDSARKKIADDTAEEMKNNPLSVDRALHINRIAGNLERIADLSTNISEDVIFIQRGVTIKHNVKGEQSPKA